MRRILILDDDAAIRFAMADFFGIKGFDVRCAETVDDARRLVEQRPPQVVISDLRLAPSGDDDGLGFLAWLGARFPAVTAIVITAYGSVASERTARLFGARAFLHKPQPMSALLATIDELLRDAGQPAEPMSADEVDAGADVGASADAGAGAAGREAASLASADEALVEAIWQDLGGQLTRERIDAMVRIVSAELAGSRIPTFVPVFVRRRATERLRASLRDGRASVRERTGGDPDHAISTPKQNRDRPSC